MRHNIKPLKQTYSNLEELQHYDAIYNIAARLGFDSCEEAWEANPSYWINGHNELVVVKARKKHVLPKVNCKFGAPMGMANIVQAHLDNKFYLIKLKWVDGDYTANGVYWGNNGKDNIYWAYNEYNHIYVRASSRKEAKEKVRELVATARFYN